MIVARIDNDITARTPYRRGRSFKGALSYLFNGARAAPNPERVLHAETVNIWSDLDNAAHEMASTWEARFRLMQDEGGLPKNGSDNKAPVYHIVMSWRADEDPPSPEEMAAHAKQLLHLLGLGEHEAVLVVHGDTANPHIHIIANTVHPITGRTAPLRFDKRIMQDFAARYEQLRGKIVCEARLASGGTSASGRRRSRARWQREQDIALEAKRAVLPSAILDELTRHHSTFTPPQLARAVTEATVSPREFTAVMQSVLAAPELVKLSDGHGRTRYTTRAQKAAETRLADAAAQLAGGLAHAVTTAAMANALDKFGGETQRGTREALTHLLDERGLAIVVGYAGAGKSTLLRSAADAWKQSGYRPRGLALAGRAAEGLEADAGIEAGTIAGFLYGLERGTTSLGSRDILVIDEAGMVASCQLDQLLHTARAAGAKVVLVGDPEQLQAIEAGGPFRYLVEHYDHARLSTVWRQQIDWMRTATKDLAEGRTASALAAYEASSMVHAHDDTDIAITTILDEWQAGRDTGGTQLILTATNADAAAINAAARLRLHAAGILGTDRGYVTADGTTEFAIGDRILFRKNDKGLKVKNGTTGTVIEATDNQLVVAVDGQPARVVRIVVPDYPHLTHGYAVTIHKSQGATVDRAYVLASPNMDRHSAYVALSRHRHRVSLHWTRDRFQDRHALTRRLSRARLKDVTLDYEPTVAATLETIKTAARDADRKESDMWVRLYDHQRRETMEVAGMSLVRRAFWTASNAARFVRAKSMTLAKLHEHERATLTAHLQSARGHSIRPRVRTNRYTPSDILMTGAAATGPSHGRSARPSPLTPS